MERKSMGLSVALKMGLFLGFGGCGKLEGVWLIEIMNDQGSDGGCSVQVEENVLDASWEDRTSDGGSWASTTESYGSNTLIFAHLMDMKAGSATLVSGGTIFPGNEQADEAFLFAWTFSDVERERTVYGDDYYYEWEERYEFTNEIKMKFDGRNSATGQYKVVRKSVEVRAESDEWGDAVGDRLGNSGNLYWYWDSASGTNRGDTVDCEGASCRITVTETCSLSAPLVAHRTDARDLSDYDALDEVMNQGELRSEGGYSWGEDTGSDWHSDSGW